MPFCVVYGNNRPPGTIIIFPGTPLLGSRFVVGWFSLKELNHSTAANASLIWNRDPFPGRVFPDGIFENLEGSGRRYIPPQADTVVLDLPNLPGNVWFTAAASDSYESVISDEVTLGLDGVARTTAGVPVQPFAFKVDRASGLFTGSVRFKDQHPVTGRPIFRTAKFTGLLVPGSYHIGSADFLLPSLPDWEGNPVKAYTSGWVTLNDVLSP